MNIIYLLIPLGLVLGGVAIVAFFWAVRSGQFDDMNTPALKILDDDEPIAANSQPVRYPQPDSTPKNGET